jgi:pseudouridine-5'-phosphate glycosidase/pseudouridine kinase
MDISGRFNSFPPRTSYISTANLAYLADLTELGRTPVTVISSGCKSFLDIPRTLEYLETEGVCVGTFADGREGSVDFPAFFTRDSGFRSPRVIQDEAEAAAIVCRWRSLPCSHSIN